MKYVIGLCFMLSVTSCFGMLSFFYNGSTFHNSSTSVSRRLINLTIQEACELGYQVKHASTEVQDRDEEKYNFTVLSGDAGCTVDQKLFLQKHITNNGFYDRGVFEYCTTYRLIDSVTGEVVSRHVRLENALAKFSVPAKNVKREGGVKLLANLIVSERVKQEKKDKGSSKWCCFK